VLRIGDELIEAVKDGEKSFSCRYEALGELAGYGGRLAREMYMGVDPGVNQGLPKQLSSYAAGTTVQLYGYSLPLFTNASSKSTALTSATGKFAVARVNGIVKGGTEQLQANMEPIFVQEWPGTEIGYGMDGVNNDVEALVLAPADPTMPQEDLMKAFDAQGGYAVISACRRTRSSARIRTTSRARAWLASR
jgi:hypothetical protein